LLLIAVDADALGAQLKWEPSRRRAVPASLRHAAAERGALDQAAAARPRRSACFYRFEN
jgi:hypothetical protein